jgi:hypothetical protein
MILSLLLATWIATSPGEESSFTNPSTLDSTMPTDSASRKLAVDSAPSAPFVLAPVIVKGTRRHSPRAVVEPVHWAKASSLGLPGAVESLREQPGVAFSSDLCGKFSSSGMPVEGSAITWEGAQILWPWHFGGLFGALDEWSTGSVEWHSLPGKPSPTQGGGWLETKSRAWSDSDQVHGAVRLGYVAGGLATWGRRGDWGWQLVARQTWLGTALEQAKANGWTQQEMTVDFKDANATLTWQHGPWKVLVGWLGASDTLGIVQDSSRTEFAWDNQAIPLSIAWQEGPWSAGVQASWSRYSRIDPEIESYDTLSLHRGSVALAYQPKRGLTLDLGLDADLWRTNQPNLAPMLSTIHWTSDSRRVLVAPRVGLRMSGTSWNLQSWAGVAQGTRDNPTAQGGLLAGVQAGRWEIQAGLERKLVTLSILDQAQTQVEPAAPAWVLPPGSSPRTSQLQLQASRTQHLPTSNLETRISALGWVRTHEGLWSWSRQMDRRWDLDSFQTRRTDGWGSGLDLEGRLRFHRLDAGLRYVLSMDVLQDQRSGDWIPPSRWAPWDQRHRLEAQLGWSWKGQPRPAPGKFYWHSKLAAKYSSGVLHSHIAGWVAEDSAQDISIESVKEWTPLFGNRRTPYLRLDFTPVSLGREGRWSFWWSIVNLTNERNLSGWFESYQPGKTQAVTQLPLIPVVFGAQIEF